MRNVLLLTLVMFFQSTHAEKLIFNNNNEEVEITGEAQIDFETGDISVTTVGEHLIVDSNDDTPVILGFYPSDYDITLGSSITVNWSVAYATSCAASTTAGTSTWNGVKNANNGSWSQSGITVSALPAILTLDCQNAAGTSTVKQFTITEQTGGGGGGGNPAITFFRVNSQSPNATVNGTASVSWAASNVSSCTASASPAVAGWAGSKALTGNQSVNFTQSGTITLTCGSQVANVNVTFNANSSCSPTVYPAGLERVEKVYTEINDGQPFGVSTNTDVLEDIGIGQFLSVSGFSLNQTNFRRRIVFEQAPTNHRLMENATISVAECPGDFSETAQCVKAVNNFSNMFFSTNPADNPALYCLMDKDTVYYFNIVLSNDPYNVTPECNNPVHEVCAIFYTETSF
ncbi:hypothetical protein [Marinicella meishanensis]|uniref:hypothetical protein n=1 Tax=Marinicella meishanensis TaxID=2873263 RepID=UPI001CC02AB7|nr:hypothetical protein [Marinicella sp. NBU2979]